MSRYKLDEAKYDEEFNWTWWLIEYFIDTIGKKTKNVKILST